MEVSLEVKDGLERRLVVEVPQDRVDSEIDTRLKSLAGQVKMDGFRPGKVPMSVVKQRFGGQVRDEVVGELIRSTFEEAVTKEQLKPASPPNIEPIEGDGLKYAATFEVYPEHELGNFADIKVVKPVVEVKDSDVDEMIETLRKQRQTWNTVERASADGDQVTIGFKGFVDGEAFEGGEASDFKLVLGSGSMIPGFEDNLVGVSAGDTPSFNVNFPDDYHAENLKGKEATFEITVDAIAEPVMPEIDEAFFAAFGVEGGDESAFRTEIQANMEREVKDRIREKIKTQIMEGVLEVNSIEVPGAMVDEEAGRLAEQRKTAGMPEAEESELKTAAERRVKLGMILSKVVEVHNMTVQPEAVRERVEQLAEAYEDPQEVIQWYYSNREKLAEVESMVIEDQFVEWVMNQCAVEEESQSFSEMVAP